MTVTQNPLPEMYKFGVKPKVKKVGKKLPVLKCTCKCDVCASGVHCSIGFENTVCEYPIIKKN